MNTPKKLILSGIFAAFALVAFMLENLFPPLFIAGGRIGIANFFVLLAGIVAGFWYGFAVLTVKAVLGSLITGNATAILYSLPAGAIAYTVQMLLILYLPKIHRYSAVTIKNRIFCLYKLLKACYNKYRCVSEREIPALRHT